MRLFGGQYAANASTDSSVLDYAQSNSLQVDILTGANYIAVPDDTTTANACGLLATHWPTSPQYKASNPWTRATWLDFFRHYTVYNLENILITAATQTACNNYNLVVDSVTLPAPLLAGYEGGIADVIPGTLRNLPNDPANNALYSQLGADLYYDPAMYDCEIAYNQSVQQAGQALQETFYLAGPIANPYYSLWPHAIWGGQPWGAWATGRSRRAVSLSPTSSADPTTKMHFMMSTRRSASQTWRD